MYIGISICVSISGISIYVKVYCNFVNLYQMPIFTLIWSVSVIKKINRRRNRCKHIKKSKLTVKRESCEAGFNK